ncbi:SPOR domain-containing protein [Aliiroseovarius sp. PTFE2010]|uniref:SPOR domain-containing protein n=1 Tax=Aliiroseovarius sp. PTFE2010 TaxID=3417190 RepID=UPI003CE92C6E
MAVYNDSGTGAFGRGSWKAQGYTQTPSQASSHHYGQQDHAQSGIDPVNQADADGTRLAGARQTASRLANISGAVVSLALIAGLGVWGYKLMVRDVSGIPVVQALETPMRIAPEDPGGNVADHLGLAVNAIAAEGQAEQIPDRLVLAPPPIELTEEDQPQSTLQPDLARVADAVPGDGRVGAAADTPRQSAAEAGEVAALSNETDPVQAALDVSAQIAATLAADNPPAFTSPVPRARPVRVASANRTVPADAVPQTQPADMDATKIPPGTRLVQFGAYDTPEMARVEWDKLALRFEALMDGKARVIQEAASGGKTFYRLRAMGFDDLSDARQFCAALVAEKAACIPTQAR